MLRLPATLCQWPGALHWWVVQCALLPGHRRYSEQLRPYGRHRANFTRIWLSQFSAHITDECRNWGASLFSLRAPSYTTPANECFPSYLPSSTHYCLWNGSFPTYSSETLLCSSLIQKWSNKGKFIKFQWQGSQKFCCHIPNISWIIWIFSIFSIFPVCFSKCACLTNCFVFKCGFDFICLFVNFPWMCAFQGMFY